MGGGDQLVGGCTLHMCAYVCACILCMCACMCARVRAGAGCVPWGAYAGCAHAFACACTPPITFMTPAVSSWSAFMSRDKVWLSMKDKSDEYTASFGLEYDFGCQDHMTGMFASQVSNGIMGFADAPNT